MAVRLGYILNQYSRRREVMFKHQHILKNAVPAYRQKIKYTKY
jgi:hypothetical protein